MLARRSNVHSFFIIEELRRTRMLKTVTVILVHAETESLLDTLIPVTDNTQPPTRCIVFVHNQDSRQLGPRSRHPRSLSQSSRAVHPVCASP